MNKTTKTIITTLIIAGSLFAQTQLINITKLHQFDGIPGNGINEALEIPHHTELNFRHKPENSAMAITCWLKTPKNNNKSGVIFERKKQNGYSLKVNSNGTLFFTWTSGKTFSLTSNVKINDGSWHHIAIVVQGTFLKLYIDGAIVANKKDRSIANEIVINAPFMIGQDQSHKNLFIGNIKDLRFYKWIIGAPTNTITKSDIISIKNDSTNTYQIENTMRVFKQVQTLHGKVSKQRKNISSSIRGAAQIKAEEFDIRKNKLRWYDKNNFFSLLKYEPSQSFLVISLLLKHGYSLSKYDYSFKTKNKTYSCLSVSAGRGFGVNLKEVIAKNKNRQVKMLFKIEKGDSIGELVFNLNSTINIPNVLVKTEKK